MSSLADALVNSRERGEIDMPGAVPLRPVGPHDDTPRGGAEISYTRTRVVKVPRALLRDNRVISGFEPGPITDAYKILAIQTLQRMREHGHNVLAVVSPGDGEGKTLTAINLALSLASEVDQTVLLVDADLRNPSIHKSFGIAPEAGLSDHLLSNTPLDRILINPGIDRFVILPGGRRLPNSAEMLGSMKMVRLVRELKQRYPSRIIVFDLPPVLSAADVLAFTPYVDAAVMVVEENRTSRDHLQRAAEMLASVELIGTVLNKSSEGEAETEQEPRGLLARLFRRRGG
jgi:protein-tyrosine kinase